MLKKLFCSSLFSFLSILFLCNFSFAQNDVDVDLITGGAAKCTFNGKVPFKSIKAANNNVVIDPLSGLTEVSINSELDTEKSTINADIFATIDAITDPQELLQGNEVEFESDEFEFSISKTSKKTGKTTEVSNETAEGDRTHVTGNVLVTSFDDENSKASGTLKMVFSNTLKTISNLEEDIETDENGKVTVICRFSDVPVNFSEDFGGLLGGL